VILAYCQEVSILHNVATEPPVNLDKLESFVVLAHPTPTKNVSLFHVVLPEVCASRLLLNLVKGAREEGYVINKVSVPRNYLSKGFSKGFCFT